MASSLIFFNTENFLRENSLKKFNHEVDFRPTTAKLQTQRIQGCGGKASSHLNSHHPPTFISTKCYLTFCLHAKILYRSHPHISPYLVLFLESTIFLRARHESICSYFSGLQNPDRQRCLAGCSPWGCKESHTTERLSAAE